jgi:hypothetical protein
MSKPGPKPRLSDEDLIWLKARDARGIPRREIAREFTQTFGKPVSTALLHKTLDARVPKPKLETVRITVVLTPEHAETLRDMAYELGYVNSRGPRAGSGHLDALLGAIAAGNVTLLPDQAPSRKIA